MYSYCLNPTLMQNNPSFLCLLKVLVDCIDLMIGKVALPYGKMANICTIDEDFRETIFLQCLLKSVVIRLLTLLDEFIFEICNFLATQLDTWYPFAICIFPIFFR